MFITIWLLNMCEIWIQILITLSTRKWYSHSKRLLLQPSGNIYTKGNCKLTDAQINGNYGEDFQITFENIQFIIHDKTQRKTQVDIGFHLSTWVCLPQNHIKELYDGYTISCNNLTESRNSTALTNFIITHTRQVSHNKTEATSIRSQQSLNSIFIAHFVFPREHQNNNQIGRTQLSIHFLYQFRRKQELERKCVSMGVTAKEKGKYSMARSVEDIVFSTEMGALDYEPTREEETFLQLIGLDRFVTRVSWEILNTSVMQEVIENCGHSRALYGGHGKLS